MNDNKNEQYPKRLPNRLKRYDYSLRGVYFITVCTKDRKQILSKIKMQQGSSQNINPCEEIQNSSVGATIGRPRKIAVVHLTPIGETVERAIKNIPNTYPAIKIAHYVIMPDHIHMLIEICADEDGRPMVAPTVSRVIQQFKGYVSKKIGYSIWQKLFYDHVVRNNDDYSECKYYITQNPIRWYRTKHNQT